MKRYKMEIKDIPWGLDGFMVRSNKGKYVDADIAQDLYRSTEVALKAISQLAEEYGAIPEYLDDITSVLEEAIEKADKD